MDTGSYKVGALESTVKSLQEDVTEIKADQKAQNGKLDLLIAEMNTRKGGMTVLISAATAAGAIAGLVIEWLKK